MHSFSPSFHFKKRKESSLIFLKGLGRILLTVECANYLYYSNVCTVSAPLHLKKKKSIFIFIIIFTEKRITKSLEKLHAIFTIVISSSKDVGIIYSTMMFCIYFNEFLFIYLFFESHKRIGFT